MGISLVVSRKYRAVFVMIFVFCPPGWFVRMQTQRAIRMPVAGQSQLA